MNSEFDKECIPAWCEDCNSEGYIFVDNPESAYFVICKGCGWKTSYAWCPKCGMGGAFVRNLGERPSDWVCPDCKTKYQLPNEFYEKTINLYTEERLPAVAREQMERDQKAEQKKLLRDFCLLAIWITVAMFPLALIFTPLPWTIPGFIVTILVFPGWWWLIGRVRVIKNMRKIITRQSS